MAADDSPFLLMYGQSRTPNVRKSVLGREGDRWVAWIGQEKGRQSLGSIVSGAWRGRNRDWACLLLPGAHLRLDNDYPKTSRRLAL